MYYKNGFTLHVEEDVDTDVVKKIFSIVDTATTLVYPWDRSPYRMPTLEEFSERVDVILEDMVGG
jgi:hypothetical protein